MKAKAEKIEKNTVALEIEVDAEVLGKGLDKAYRKLVKKANIPGFRKGKAPRVILERHYGKEYLLSEAVDAILPEVYADAVAETEIEPIDRPDVEIVQAEEGLPLIVKAKVLVKPEVQLGEYKGVKVEKPAGEITDADVENDLQKLQQRHAKVNTLDEGEVVNGDIAVIDFEGFMDGEAFPGGKGEAYPLEIGSGSFIPGFEEQLIGANVGEEKEVTVNFPEDYHSQDLAGKPALFKVKINTIRRKEILPLDDEFVKDVSEFDTLEELKNDIRNRLKEAAEKNADIAIRAQVIKQAVENSTLEVPEVMIETRLNMMIQELAQRMQSQGIPFEEYMKYTGSDIEKLKDRMRPEAEQNVSSDLVLEAIARKEDIDATEEEVNEQLAKMAEQYQQDISTIRVALESQGSMDNVKNSIAFQKTVQFLVDNAQIA